MNALLQIAIKLVLALVTEKVVKETVLLAAKELAKRTDTDVDDKIVAIVEKAWEGK